MNTPDYTARHRCTANAFMSTLLYTNSSYFINFKRREMADILPAVDTAAISRRGQRVLRCTETGAAPSTS